jgi:peptide-methionine (S)-S-oxide reductase
MAKATFAAGCFWQPEVIFRNTDGVTDTRVGYIGGETENPSYEQVCTGRTGHAEAVEVTYDPAKVSYDQLLEIFWECHDPTQKNRQGPDVGTQYRSAIFVHDDQQREAAERSKSEQQRRLRATIQTEIQPARTFWPAEEYHQQYLQKRGLATCKI